MNESVCKLINGQKRLIICFGGMALKFLSVPPFEFLNYLSKTYEKNYDFVFIIDKKQCWYHKGIDGITKNIDETVIYLDEMILAGKYEKVLFMGTSAGGYASILFGSLCKNVSCVISFVPQTVLIKPIDKKYKNLRNVINNTTKYRIHGDMSVLDKKNNHHISHCENIKGKKNVKIIRHPFINMKQLRDGGKLKRMIDNNIGFKG